jgi:hypothetical protein
MDGRVKPGHDAQGNGLTRPSIQKAKPSHFKIMLRKGAPAC